MPSRGWACSECPHYKVVADIRPPHNIARSEKESADALLVGLAFQRITGRLLCCTTNSENTKQNTRTTLHIKQKKTPSIHHKHFEPQLVWRKANLTAQQTTNSSWVEKPNLHHGAECKANPQPTCHLGEMDMPLMPVNQRLILNERWTVEGNGLGRFNHGPRAGV